MGEPPFGTGFRDPDGLVVHFDCKLLGEWYCKLPNGSLRSYAPHKLKRLSPLEQLALQAPPAPIKAKGDLRA